MEINNTIQNKKEDVESIHIIDNNNNDNHILC